MYTKAINTSCAHRNILFFREEDGARVSEAQPGNSTGDGEPKKEFQPEKIYLPPYDTLNPREKQYEKWVLLASKAQSEQNLIEKADRVNEVVGKLIDELKMHGYTDEKQMQGMINEFLGKYSEKYHAEKKDSESTSGVNAIMLQDFQQFIREKKREKYTSAYAQKLQDAGVDREKSQALAKEFMALGLYRKEKESYRQKIKNMGETVDEVKLQEHMQSYITQAFQDFCQEKWVDMTPDVPIAWVEENDHETKEIDNIFEAIDAYKEASTLDRTVYEHIDDIDHAIARDELDDIISNAPDGFEPDELKVFEQSGISFEQGTGWTKIMGDGEWSDWIIYSDTQDDVRAALDIYQACQNPPLDEIRSAGYETIQYLFDRMDTVWRSVFPGGDSEPTMIEKWKLLQYVFLRNYAQVGENIPDDMRSQIQDLPIISVKDSYHAPSDISMKYRFLPESSILRQAKEARLITEGGTPIIHRIESMIRDFSNK